jgi:hypothetical protein
LRLEESFLAKIQFAFGKAVCIEAVLKSNFGMSFSNVVHAMICLSFLRFERFDCIVGGTGNAMQIDTGLLFESMQTFNENDSNALRSVISLSIEQGNLFFCLYSVCLLFLGATGVRLFESMQIIYS